MKKLFLSHVLCLLALSVFAQQYDLSGNKIRNFQNKALDASFYRYSVFSIDVAPLLGIASTDSRTFDFRISLEEYLAVNTQLKPTLCSPKIILRLSPPTKGREPFTNALKCIR